MSLQDPRTLGRPGTAVRGAPGRQPAAAATGPSLARRVLAAVALVLAVAVSVVGFALLPGSPAQSDTSDHFQLHAPLPQLEEGAPFVAPVDVRAPGLSGVSVAFATYLGSLDCSVDVTLREPSAGASLASQRHDCSALTDNLLTDALLFPPLDGTTTGPLELEVAVVEGSVTDGPSIWVDPSGTPVVVEQYGQAEQLEDHVGETVERMQLYGPAWSSTPSLVVMGALVLVALALLVLSPRWGLVALVAIVLVRGLLWSALLPPLMGMDEGAHFANVQFMAEEGRLPDKAEPFGTAAPYSDSIDVASDGLHVNYLARTDRPDYTEDARRALELADAQASAASNGTGAAAGYPPLYYAPPVLLYQAAGDSTVDQVVLARLWSVALGAVLAVATWFVARLVFPASYPARVALVLAVALQPMLAHQSAIVNNDIWVILWGAVALGIGLAFLQRSPSRWLALAGGAVIGMAILGKPYGVAVGIPIGVGWLFAVWRRGRSGAGTSARDLALFAAGGGLTYGVWLVVARVLGLATTNGFPPDTGAPGPRGVRAYLSTQFGNGPGEVIGIWVRQFWGNFAWVNTPLPEAAYDVLTGAVTVLLVLVALWLLTLPVRALRTEEAGTLDRVITVCVAYVAGTLAFLYLVEFLYFRATGVTDLLQGRYALMVVPALLALPGLLLSRLSRGRVPAGVTNAVVAAGVFGLHLLSVGVVAEHFYG